MTPSKNLVGTAAIFLTFYLFAGCAFRVGPLPVVSPWPPGAAIDRKSISLTLSGKTIVNGQAREFDQYFLDECRKQMLHIYQASGLFSQVHAGGAETDLRADVQLIDQQVLIEFWDVLTLFTGFLTPTTHTDGFLMLTTIKDQDGNVLGSFHQLGAIITVYQLFLLLSLPSHLPDVVTKETLSDLHRATLLEAHSQGLL